MGEKLIYWKFKNRQVQVIIKTDSIGRYSFTFNTYYCSLWFHSNTINKYRMFKKNFMFYFSIHWTPSPEWRRATTFWKYLKKNPNTLYVYIKSKKEVGHIFTAKYSSFYESRQCVFELLECFTIDHLRPAMIHIYRTSYHMTHVFRFNKCRCVTNKKEKRTIFTQQPKLSKPYLVF